MSEFLKIENNKNYFLTLTVKDWVDIFTRLCYVEIIIESIKYCQLKKGLDIYAYVIMPTHIHLLAGTDGNLSDILRDMKGYTSRMILREIKENPSESRREWLLERFITSTGFQFWQEGNYPIEVFSRKFVLQKEHYIHMNPVEAGYVINPQDYRLSSASPYSPIKVLGVW